MYTYLYIYYCIYIYYIIYILYYICIYIYTCACLFTCAIKLHCSRPPNERMVSSTSMRIKIVIFLHETMKVVFQGVTIHILKINQTSVLCFICAKTLQCHLFSSIAVVRTQTVPRSLFEMYCPQLYNRPVPSCNPKDQEKMME